MGKCKIINHIAGGEYTVDLLPDFSVVETNIAKITVQLSNLQNVELLQLEVEFNDKSAITDAAQGDVDAAIAVYAASPTKENSDAVQDAIGVLGDAVNDEVSAGVPLQIAKARELSLQKTITRLNDAITDPIPITAWCADLADGLEGRPVYAVDDEVGTIEILGEDANGINLQPEFTGQGDYLVARDGISAPVATFTPESYFYNRAMLPPWQKWQTTYRTGIITAAGTGGFTIELDDIKSAEQFPLIPVNDLQDGVLTFVNAQYMNCNNAAFTVDDHVVISSTYDALRNRTDTIVGFVDNPKPCNFKGFAYRPFVVGGTQPGFHDWQNVRDDLSVSWEMFTPFNSDITLSSPSRQIEDWKGTLTSGNNILVQWQTTDAVIYVDGITTAVIPNFTAAEFTGSPGGATSSFTFFHVAWVTLDKKYLYAVPRFGNGNTRYIIRKTINPELTGNAYNATTDPDGWEISAPYGPADYTNFDRFQGPAVNTSGTELRAMDTWVHGAKQTPPLSPGVGAIWLTVAAYEDTWPEESQITITNPSATTISAAGITHQFNGFTGDYIYRTTNSDATGVLSGQDNTWYMDGTYNFASTTVFTGSYPVRVGYQGDTVGYVWITGQGTDTLTNDTTIGDVSGGTYQTQDQSEISVGFGTIYEFDFEAFTYPRRFTTNTDMQRTYDVTAPQSACEGTFRSSNYHTDEDGILQYTNIADGVYQISTDILTAASEVNFSNSTDCGLIGGCIGAETGEDRVDETGYILLGITEKSYTRNAVTAPGIGTVCTGSPTTGVTYAPILTTYGADPFTWLASNPTTSKINETARTASVTSNGRFTTLNTAKDFSDNYIMSVEHTYDDSLNTLFDDFLTGGDLSTLDGLDNGTGTAYRYTHVLNSI